MLGGASIVVAIAVVVTLARDPIGTEFADYNFISIENVAFGPTHVRSCRILLRTYSPFAPKETAEHTGYGDPLAEYNLSSVIAGSEVTLDVAEHQSVL